MIPDGAPMPGDSHGQKRKRGEAYAGAGYGTHRRRLLERARDHIERSISLGFYCEAIAISESIIADRLESRLSYVRQKAGKEKVAFMTLGQLLRLGTEESDDELRGLFRDIGAWAELRNRALHEMVKVGDGEGTGEWEDKIRANERIARAGYELAKRLYHRVADLNPKHADRVLPIPERDSQDR